MIHEVLQLIAAVLWLAGGIGALGGICFFFLGPLYESWKFNKYQVDTHIELFLAAREAVDAADGRAVAVSFIIEGEDDE